MVRLKEILASIQRYIFTLVTEITTYLTKCSKFHVIQTALTYSSVTLQPIHINEIYERVELTVMLCVGIVQNAVNNHSDIMIFQIQV
jgi:hypothetical protein